MDIGGLNYGSIFHERANRGIIHGMAKLRDKKAVVKTDAAFYAQVRDVFVQARQFVHKTANFAMVRAGSTWHSQIVTHCVTN